MYQESFIFTTILFAVKSILTLIKPLCKPLFSILQFAIHKNISSQLCCVKSHSDCLNYPSQTISKFNFKSMTFMSKVKVIMIKSSCAFYLRNPSRNVKIVDSIIRKYLNFQEKKNKNPSLNFSSILWVTKLSKLNVPEYIKINTKTTKIMGISRNSWSVAYSLQHLLH